MINVCVIGQKYNLCMAQSTERLGPSDRCRHGGVQRTNRRRLAKVNVPPSARRQR